jgi:hypothetical protein
MKSSVAIDIHAPRSTVAELFADPLNNPRWMNELDRIDVVSGQLGAQGSQYRMVSKDGQMDFVATVVLRDLPTELHLRLDGSHVAVLITDRFLAPSRDVTRLISEEVFRFEGPIRRLFGIFTRVFIRKAHRRHMQSFKRFAEAHERRSTASSTDN